MKQFQLVIIVCTAFFCSTLIWVTGRAGQTGLPGEIRLVSDSVGQQPGSISVDGLATMEVTPDIADVTVTLTGKAADTKSAYAEASRQKDALLALLKAMDNSSELGIRTGTSQVTPAYRYTARGEQRPDGHIATLSLTISTKDFARLHDIMEAGANVGASNSSVAYRSINLDAKKIEVRQLALKAAREKAEQMVGAAGAKLGRVLSISESPGGSGWSYFGGLANSSKQIELTESTVAVTPGAQPLTLNVSITYELAS